MARMANATHIATIKTNQGDIVVELFGNHAPKTVKNFVGLATGEQEWTHPQTGEKNNGERVTLSPTSTPWCSTPTAAPETTCPWRPPTASPSP